MEEPQPGPCGGDLGRDVNTVSGRAARAATESAEQQQQQRPESLPGRAAALRRSRSSPGSRAPPAAARADPAPGVPSAHPAREKWAQQMHLSASERSTGDLTAKINKNSKVVGEAPV